jgi:hypothetical protein
MPSSVYRLIRDAIINKHQVIATYHGFKREMCPHAIGLKNGAEQALLFQFAGDTSKGPIKTDAKNNWRCLTLSTLRDVTAHSGSWHTFNNYSQQSTCIDHIDVEVAPSSNM